MNEVTLVLAYYDNPQMLDLQLMRLSLLPADLRAQIHLAVTDDGSPRWPAQISTDPGLASVQLFRITVDVRWNQDAARNLAAAHAPTPWLLLTDMDHLVTEEAWRRVIEGPLNPWTVYRFSRQSITSDRLPLGPKDLAPYKPHPNSWCMTRATFDRIGGYDEALAGYYGTDGDFRDRVRRSAQVEMLPQPLIRVPREVVADASTTTYGRKEPQDREALPKLKDARAGVKDWRPQRGRFPWVRVV